MRALKWIFTSLVLTAGLSGCYIDFDNDADGGCLDGRGPVVSERLELNRIESLNLQIPAIVYLRKGEKQEIVIEAQDNIIGYLNREVRAGHWEVEVDRCIRDMENVRIFLTLPEISGLEISGSGQIVSEEMLQLDDVSLGISGSGNINLSMTADDVEAVISGSGEIRFNGAADEVLYRVTGSGDMLCFGLQARKGTVEIKGSGDVEVFVEEELDVNISGSGNVYYKGAPEINVRISGSGEVVNDN